MKKTLYILPFILTVATMMLPSVHPSKGITIEQAKQNLEAARHLAWIHLEIMQAVCTNRISTDPEKERAKNQYALASSSAKKASEFLDSMVHMTPQAQEIPYTPTITPIPTRDPKLDKEIADADKLMMLLHDIKDPKAAIPPLPIQATQATTDTDLLVKRFARHATEKRIALAREFAAEATKRPTTPDDKATTGTSCALAQRFATHIAQKNRTALALQFAANTAVAP